MIEVIAKIKDAISELDNIVVNPQLKVVLKVLSIIVFVLEKVAELK